MENKSDIKYIKVDIERLDEILSNLRETMLLSFNDENKFNELQCVDTKLILSQSDAMQKIIFLVNSLL